MDSSTMLNNPVDRRVHAQSAETTRTGKRINTVMQTSLTYISSPLGRNMHSTLGTAENINPTPELFL